MYSVSGLTISFERDQPFTAVRDLSFSIDKGKTLAIVGESGSGKSLTALALMGLLPPAATLTVSVSSSIQSPNSKIQIPLKRGKDIGMVFQEPMSSLNPVMKVGKQVQEAILIHQKISKAAAKELAINWLDKVLLPNPAKMFDRYPHELSGGQKQRVMIAIAMCNHPTLLIADEPTTALDATVQLEIVRLMQYLQQEHQTAMIFITHDLSLAATIADDVLVMYKGEMVEYGTAEQVLKHPQQAYTKALLACKPSPDHKGFRLPVISDFTDSKQFKTFEPVLRGSAIVLPGNSTLLEVKNLGIWYAERPGITGGIQKQFKAVDDVSFILRKGEVLGLAGESGCGKSTLGRCIAGLLPANTGQLLFNGTDLATLSTREWRSMHRQVQMVFQDPYSSLNPRMTIGDMLAEPLRVHKIVPEKETENEAKRLLNLVQLPASARDKYPHQFSGGQRQRLVIARALALRPQLLICDESVSALDVSIQAQILNLLKDLQHEFSLTYLFISHDLSVVYYLSDRVMIMQAGKIIESGDAEGVLKHPKEEYTKRLVAAMP